ncbi:Hypothetical predicted protein [Cloeon dipterum]|uniref:Uncharacterized protein n=1 Tax=Cloeon dipterum TaxID=197152 RepID=A0A8S1D8F3_9INSE|nr:Hypothetical predicted protein [Cloeon dipterum]
MTQILSCVGGVPINLAEQMSSDLSREKQQDLVRLGGCPSCKTGSDKNMRIYAERVGGEGEEEVENEQQQRLTHVAVCIRQRR